MKLSVEQFPWEISVDLPNLSRVFGVLAILIAVFGLFPNVRGILVLFADVILELLLGMIALNFTGWLFFHASYFEKANRAKATRTDRVRQALTLIKDKQEQLTNDRLDYWMKIINQEYGTVSRLDADMNGVRGYFLVGTGASLLGAVLQLAQNPAPWDFLLLVASVVCFVLAVLDGNSMMKLLSQTTMG